jgi:hypothetical protein
LAQWTQSHGALWRICSSVGGVGSCLRMPARIGGLARRGLASINIFRHLPGEPVQL